ncbi:MAG: EAL domain-containing protein, partial [Spirochaetia bacterium]|nr:EAL domain-containing protein [Spirochaetia bacterium]
GGYSLYDYSLPWYQNHLWEDRIPLRSPYLPDRLAKFQGNLPWYHNPVKTVYVRRNIAHILECGYFSGELEFFRNLTERIMPLFHWWYLDLALYEEKDGFKTDWRLKRTEIRTRLVEEGRNMGRAFRGDGTTLAFISASMTIDEVKKFYGRMRAFARESLTVDGNKIGAEIAGGLIISTDHNVDEHSIYTSAKYALDYSKKQKHGNLIIFHNDELDNNKSSIELVNEVRNSVINGFDGFYLEYQPIVAASDGRLVGMEVFVRWHKDPYGDVSPAEFVPWLEQDPVFYALGNWILENSLKDALEIRKNNKDFYLGVNLAFMQLERSEFRTTLLEILRKTGYPATGLCLQMTSSSRQLSIEHLKSQVEFIKSCGIKIGIDCSEFSALDYVRHLPIDHLNLAPTLTGYLADNLTVRYMIEAITSFAHRLGIRTCFTGIEDQETANLARQYPVSDFMGYYYGRPCRIEEFRRQIYFKK